MKINQGDIIFGNLDPTKGHEPKKTRPCVVISNQNYNRYFNTVIVIPISSSLKYQTEERYLNSPLFYNIDQGGIKGTALLQHVRALQIEARSNGKVITTLSNLQMENILLGIKSFF